MQICKYETGDKHKISSNLGCERNARGAASTPAPGDLASLVGFPRPADMPYRTDEFYSIGPQDPDVPRYVPRCELFYG